MHADDFDFWLGTWRGTWGTGYAVNEVTRTLEGQVVLERFSAIAPETFSGMSVSVYDEQAKRWKQTWVDNAGSYLDFEGGPVEGGMQLSRKATLEGVEVVQRMVWAEIEDERFQWYWQRSRDGSSWETVWHISYERLLARAA